MKKIIIVMGPAGSGKSTIGRQVAAISDAEYISSGDIVRSLSDAHKDLAEGQLYHNDEVVMGGIFDRINSSDKGAFIIDGIPRNEGQIIWLDEELDNYNWRIVHIDASITKRYERLISRKRDQYDEPEIVMKRLIKDTESISDLKARCINKFGSEKVVSIYSENTGNTSNEVNYLMSLFKEMNKYNGVKL